MMSTLARQTKSSLPKDQNIGAKDAVATLHIFLIL